MLTRFNRNAYICKQITTYTQTQTQTHTHTRTRTRMQIRDHDCVCTCRIKRSNGAYVDFALTTSGARAEQLDPVRVFTTRPDTLHGVTYLAVTPSHPLAAGATGTCSFQSLASFMPSRCHAKAQSPPLNRTHAKAETDRTSPCALAPPPPPHHHPPSLPPPPPSPITTTTTTEIAASRHRRHDPRCVGHPPADGCQGASVLGIVRGRRSARQRGGSAYPGGGLRRSGLGLGLHFY